MDWYHYLLIALGGLLFVLILIILIRTFTFKDKTNYNRQVKEIKCDGDVVDCLSKMIKIDTTSHPDKKDINHYILLFLKSVNLNKQKITQ